MPSAPPPTLAALAARNFTEKKILSPLKKCLKKLSFKSSADLNHLMDLALWLYVYGYDAEALRVCQLAEPVEFQGDFQIWGPVEDLLLLAARIYREQKKPARAKACVTKVLKAMEGHEEAFRRRLSFEWLSDKSIARYEQAGNVRVANEIRFADLRDLGFIRELGKGRKDLHNQPAPVAQAEARIKEYKKILKQVK